MSGSESYLSTQDGLRLHYHVLGGGSDTLLVPIEAGLAADMEALAEGRRLIFYDDRGRGLSDADPNPTGRWTDDEPRDMETARQHFDLDRADVFGWSYKGGSVALYAAAYPDRVRRLVMMCPIAPRYPAPYHDQEAVERLRQARTDPAGVARLEAMQQAGLDQSDPAAYCRESSRVYAPRQMGRPEALARRRSDPCACPNEWPRNLGPYFGRLFPDGFEWDWRERAARITARTLVIHGTEDLIPLRASQEWAAAIPDARLLVIPGSGHFPHLEAPEVFFPAVDAFLRGEWPKAAEIIAPEELA